MLSPTQNKISLVPLAYTASLILFHDSSWMLPPSWLTLATRSQRRRTQSWATALPHSQSRSRCTPPSSPCPPLRQRHEDLETKGQSDGLFLNPDVSSCGTMAPSIDISSPTTLLHRFTALLPLALLPSPWWRQCGRSHPWLVVRCVAPVGPPWLQSETGTGTGEREPRRGERGKSETSGMGLQSPAGMYLLPSWISYQLFLSNISSPHLDSSMFCA